MNTRHMRVFACSAALILAASACTSGGSDPVADTAPVASPTTTAAQTGADDALDEAAPTTTEPTPTTAPSGPPHAAELPWGNFELAERIAAKVAAGEPLNFVISLTATGEDSLNDSFSHGWEQAAADVAARYGVAINARVIGPNSADADAQATTITSLIASGDIDCLAVEAANPRLLDGAIGEAVDAGVPTYAVSGDSPDSKRFAFFGFDAYAAGRSAGQLVGDWAADGGILVRRAAVLTGDARHQRSFDLMRGFTDGLLEIHSGVEFVNGPADVDSFGFEPVPVYDATEAWVLDNLDVDIVFHTDDGVEALAAVMADQLLYGDMYAVAFHMSPQVADYVRERLVVTALVQGYTAQAQAAGGACGDFLLAGLHETGHMAMAPTPVTRDNVDELDWSLPQNR